MAGSACVALAELPVCVARVPPVAPSARLACIYLVSLRPVISASVTDAIAAVCLMSSAELSVEVAGPLFPVCPRIATIYRVSIYFKVTD